MVVGPAGNRRFWGLGGPGGPRNHSRRWGAKPPTFWNGFGGRPDPQASTISGWPKNPCMKHPSVLRIRDNSGDLFSDRFGPPCVLGWDRVLAPPGRAAGAMIWSHPRRKEAKPRICLRLMPRPRCTQFNFILSPEMALEWVLGADFGCSLHCKTSPVVLEGSRGQVLGCWVVLEGFRGGTPIFPCGQRLAAYN